MRFLLFTIAAASTGLGPADEGAVGAVDRFNRALREAGVLLGTHRLRPATIQAPLPVTGGPVTARVSATAFWLIQVRSLDEALAWAQRCPLAPDESIEIRIAIPHGASA